MRNSSKDIPSSYMVCWSDFKERMNREDQEIGVHRAEVFSFPQTWPNTSCGHGGLAGQAFTTAQTWVFKLNNQFFVYQGDRFSYCVEDPNDEFFEDLCNHDLCGSSEYTTDYEK